MKFKLLSLSLLSVSAVSPFFVPSLTPSAMALGCVATDVAVQLNVSGDRRGGRQTNDAKQQFGENCVGNTVNNTANQINVGPNAADQDRRSNAVLGTGRHGGPGKGDVGFKVNIQRNIYNPAADPNFLKKYRR